MKRVPRLILSFGCILLILVAWATGFVMGNASGSKRSAIGALYKESQLLRSIRAGKTDQAESHAELFIAANYRHLNSRPFWMAALSEHFEVDDEALYQKVEPEASATAAGFFAKAVPVEEAINEALEEARKRSDKPASP